MQNHVSKEIRIAYHIGQLMLYILAANCVLSMFLFHANISISWYSLPLSIIIALLLFLVFYGETISRQTILEIITVFFLIIVTCSVAICLCDLSYDGNFYHKFAVGLLRHGWNPVKESAENFCVRSFGYNFGSDAYIWVESYCKQSWIFAASLYALIGNIEAGKCYTILSIIIVFSIVYSYLRSKKYSRWKSIAICAIISLNPIAVAQLDTYYIDGYLFNILFSLIFVLMMNMDKHFPFNSRSTASLVACAMCICANIKFTGLLYGGLYCIVYFIFWAIYQYIDNRHMSFKCIATRLSGFAILALFCILGAGYSPYITNLTQHGSMTYPLTGHGAVDIMTINTPDILKNIHPIKQLLYSIFSKMGNMVSSESTQSLLKVPFTTFDEEFLYLTLPDARIGGFGILFSGILLVCISILTYYLISKKLEKKARYFCILNAGLSVVLCLIISESWWARYAPYIYFLIIETLIILLDPTISDCNAKKHYLKFTLNGISIALLCLCLINNGWFFTSEDEIAAGKQLTSEISGLQQADKVYIDFGNFPGRIFNYFDQSISLEPDESISDNSQKLSSGFGGIYYLVEGN